MESPSRSAVQACAASWIVSEMSTIANGRAIESRSKNRELRADQGARGWRQGRSRVRQIS